MSEVAVKIYETKKDIQRIHLKEPLHGKNGLDQMGTWINTFTNEEVTSYTYSQVGNYRLEYVMVGQKIEDVEGPFAEVDGEYNLRSEQTHDIGDIQRWETDYFVSKAQLLVPITGIQGLQPNTLLSHYYIVIRFLDE